MLVKRTSSLPLGQVLLLVGALGVALVVAQFMQPSPQGPIQAGAAVAATDAPATVPAPEPAATQAPHSEVPTTTGEPVVRFHAIILTPEEAAALEASQGEDTMCPNNEECGFGELSTPLP